MTWKSLHGQFGIGYNRLDHFRRKFSENLHLAAAVYPDAKVAIDAKGVVLFPSRPPVAPRMIASSPTN